MIYCVDSYYVTSNQSIPIRIDLEKNTTLQIETYVEWGVTEDRRIRYQAEEICLYAHATAGNKPAAVYLTDDKGNSTTREVTVVYTPADPKQQLFSRLRQAIQDGSDRYMGWHPWQTVTWPGFCRVLILDQMQFNSLADLYDYLVEHAAENNYTLAEVDELMARFLSQKDLNYFQDELKSLTDSLTKNHG